MLEVHVQTKTKQKKAYIQRVAKSSTQKTRSSMTKAVLAYTLWHAPDKHLEEKAAGGY